MNGARSALNPLTDIHAMSIHFIPFVSLAEASFGGTEGPDMTRYAVLSALLVALIGGIAFMLRKVFVLDSRRRSSERSLRIVDVLPLGGRQKLCVVRCYDRTFALGLGDKEVSLVAELDTLEDAAPAPSARVAKSEKRSFEGALERIRAQLARTPDPAVTPAAPPQRRVKAPVPQVAKATPSVAKPAAKRPASKKRRPVRPAARPKRLDEFEGVVG